MWVNKRKAVKWAPRGMGIFFGLFLMLFSLDVIQPGLSIGQIAGGLLMHNLPSLALFTIVAVAWKHEIVGGVIFLLAGLAYFILLASNQNFEWYMISWLMTISGPAWLIGYLYILSWKMGKKEA